MPKKLDLSGKVSGRLKAIKESGKDRHGNIMWECSCSCGSVTKVSSTRLKREVTKSCGCLHKEKVTSHSLSKNPLYQIWSDIKQRCHNKNRHNYHRYGGRSILFNKEWEQSPETFILWVEENLGPKPKGMSIDRVDNNKGYEPDNLKWSTPSEQSFNRENSLKTEEEKNNIIKALEKSFCNKNIAAEILGISIRTLYRKIDKYNL